EADCHAQRREAKNPVARLPSQDVKDWIPGQWPLLANRPELTEDVVEHCAGVRRFADREPLDDPAIAQARNGVQPGAVHRRTSSMTGRSAASRAARRIRSA